MHLPSALGVDFPDVKPFSLEQSEEIQNTINLQFLEPLSTASSLLIPDNPVYSFSTSEVPSQSVLMAITAVRVTIETTPYSRQSAAGAWGEFVLWVSK